MSESIRIPGTTRHLDDLTRLVRGELHAPPIARLIGFDLKKIELGRSVMELDADERHANPMGTLHGGVICDVADAAMVTATVPGARHEGSSRTGPTSRPAAIPGAAIPGHQQRGPAREVPTQGHTPRHSALRPMPLTMPRRAASQPVRSGARSRDALDPPQARPRHLSTTAPCPYLSTHCVAAVLSTPG